MKKGELILACLKLVFDIDNINIDDEVDSITTDNADLQSRIVNIPYSIDRALNEIAKNEKLPKKTIENINAFCGEESYSEVNELPTNKTTEFIRYNNNLYKWNEEKSVYDIQPLSVYMSYELPTDVYKIQNISWGYDSGYYYQSNDNIPIKYKNTNEIFLPRNLNGNYSLTYSPHYVGNASLLKDEDIITNGDDVIPDYILRIVPYFVKADIYEEDGLNEAVMARNLFNSYLAELDLNNTYQVQNKVKTIYRM